MRIASLMLILGLTGTAHAAGHVWVVGYAFGPGVDFVSLDNALDAAADGDTILMTTGDYDGGAIVGKSLVITVATGATVNLSGDLSVWNLAADQSVALSGLTSSGTLQVTLHSNAGPVWIQNCTLHGQGYPGGGPFGFSTSEPAVKVTNCASVVVSDCLLTGGTAIAGEDAVRVENSNVHIFASTLLGGFGACDNDVFLKNCGASGAGLHVLSGFVSVQSCSLTGGAAGPGDWKEPFGCLFSPPQVGAPGLLLESGEVQAYDVTLAAGGATAPCGTAGTEPVHVTTGTYAAAAGTGLHVQVPNPLASGSAGSFTVAGAPGDLVLMGLSLTAGQIWVPKLHAPWLLGAPFQLVPLQVLDATGILQLPYVVPQLPAGLEGAAFYVQPARLAASGGLLGNPVEPIILDV